MEQLFTTQFIFEFIGYIGTALVIISYLMTSIIQLRAINCVACVAQLIYAGFICSVPVIILNGFVLTINTVQIIIYYKKKAKLEIHNTELGSSELIHFIFRNGKMIKVQYPNFDSKHLKGNYLKAIYIDDLINGAVIGQKEGNKLDVYFDYCEHKNLKKIYEKFIKQQFSKDNIKKVIFHDIPKKLHRPYLSIGCKAQGNNLVLDIA